MSQKHIQVSANNVTDNFDKSVSFYLFWFVEHWIFSKIYFEIYFLREAVKTPEM